MKIKLHVVITNPIKFAAGDIEWSVNLFAEPSTVEGWHNLHAVEVEVPDDLVPELHKEALAKLDEQEKDARANFERAMQEVNRTRDRLLALPHDSEGGSDNDQ